MIGNKYGLYYEDSNNKAHFVKSFKTLDELNNYIINTPEFLDIKKKNIFVAILIDEINEVNADVQVKD